MRLIALRTLQNFWTEHPDAKPSLERWALLIREGCWKSTAEVKGAFSNAKVLNGERVRFEVRSGYYRLIASFDFKRQIAFVKFIGSHAAYDACDPFNVDDH